jgi:hypothetical protein
MKQEKLKQRKHGIKEDVPPAIVTGCPGNGDKLVNTNLFGLLFEDFITLSVGPKLVALINSPLNGTNA